MSTPCCSATARGNRVERQIIHRLGRRPHRSPVRSRPEQGINGCTRRPEKSPPSSTPLHGYRRSHPPDLALRRPPGSVTGCLSGVPGASTSGTGALRKRDKRNLREEFGQGSSCALAPVHWRCHRRRRRRRRVRHLAG
jgi:hypothetical protein